MITDNRFVVFGKKWYWLIPEDAGGPDFYIDENGEAYNPVGKPDAQCSIINVLEILNIMSREIKQFDNSAK